MWIVRPCSHPKTSDLLDKCDGQESRLVANSRSQIGFKSLFSIEVKCVLVFSKMHHSLYDSLHNRVWLVLVKEKAINPLRGKGPSPMLKSHSMLWPLQLQYIKFSFNWVRHKKDWKISLWDWWLFTVYFLEVGGGSEDFVVPQNSSDPSSPLRLCQWYSNDPPWLAVNFLLNSPLLNFISNNSSPLCSIWKLCRCSPLYWWSMCNNIKSTDIHLKSFHWLLDTSRLIQCVSMDGNLQRITIIITDRMFTKEK